MNGQCPTSFGTVNIFCFGYFMARQETRLIPTVQLRLACQELSQLSHKITF